MENKFTDNQSKVHIPALSSSFRHTGLADLGTSILSFPELTLL